MKVLIGYDGSCFADAILGDLRYAGIPRDAEVMVITFAEPEYFLVGKKSEGVVGWLSYKLIEARASARLARDRIQTQFPHWDVFCESRLASPQQELLKKVAEWGPDLVIVGQHGRAGLKRSGLGRVAKRLFKESSCPVRIARARPGPRAAPPRIMIPLSASLISDDVTRVITARSWPPGTEVKLIASIGPILSEMQLAYGVIDAQRKAVLELQRTVEKKMRSARLLVSSELISDFATDDLTETAKRWGADCVFIGARAMSFFEKVFCGDFVSIVATRAECSVEVVHSPGCCDMANSECGANATLKDSFRVAS